MLVLQRGGCARTPPPRWRQLLPLDAFTPKPHLYSGYDSWCRPCRNAYLREWRAQRKAAG
jgi:hypothetical protein